MIHEVQEELILTGYHQIQIQPQSIQVLYHLQEQKAIFLWDCPTGMEISRDQYEKQLGKLKSLVVVQTGILSPECLSIIFTQNALAMVSYCNLEGENWVVDTKQRRVVITNPKESLFPEEEELIWNVLENRDAMVEKREALTRTKENTRFYTSSLITLLLIGTNVLIYLILETMGSTTDGAFLIQHGAAYRPLIVEGKQYYRLFTCMFLHAGVMHLVNNMFVLLFLGSRLEKMIGKVKYLILYMVSGILSSMASLGYDILLGHDVPSVGASGAIFGVTGAIAYLILFQKKRQYDISKSQIILFVALSLYSGYQSVNVDNIAHISGCLFGFLIAAVITIPKKGRNAS